MNRNDYIKIPKFLEGEPLPKGYFEAPNPYAAPPTRKVKLGELVKYARDNGKKVFDLTKEEVSMFEHD
jgi:hypothetical protein